MKAKKLSPESLAWLIDLHKEKNVVLEGPVLRYIDPSLATPEQIEYLRRASEQDEVKTKRRLEVNKLVQRTNVDLKLKTEALDVALEESQAARADAEKAKATAERAEADALGKLDAETKRNQFALINKATTYLLWFIGVIIVLSFAAWVIAVLTEGSDEVMSNVFSGVLTNSLVGALSLLGGAIGVQSATKNNNDGSTESTTNPSSFFDDNPPAV